MVRKLLSAFNRDFSSLHEAAYILALSAVGSQVLALVRDRLFASTFGAGTVLDVYYASFRVPDLVYVFIASLVAATVLIPFVTEKLTNENKKEVSLFLGKILTFFIVLMIAVSAILFVAMPYLSDLVVPGFTEKEQETFVTLSRLLLLSPFFLGLSNLIGSAVQALRKFFVYALTPIVYNLSIIFGILFLYEPFGVEGLVYGVLLGAFLHFAIQVPLVVKEGIFPRLTPSFDTTVFKEVARLSLPRTLTLSVHHVLIIVFVSIASGMLAGSISIFTLAYNLQAVPVAIIGMSYSVAAFPTLSRLFSEGNKETFVNYIITAARHIIFWSLPVLALFVVLRAQIVRTILGAGAFNWQDTRLTAAALALFSFAVVAQNLMNLFVRGFYAAGDTKKPLVINLVSGVLILIFSFYFLHIFETNETFRGFFESLFRVSGIPGTQILMLPLAFSLGAIINMTLIWKAFKREFRDEYVSLRKNFFQSLSGALIIGITSYFFLQVFADVFDLDTFMGIFLQGLCAGVGGLIAGGLFYSFVNNREFVELRDTLTRKLFAKKPVQPDQGELWGDTHH